MRITKWRVAEGLSSVFNAVSSAVESSLSAAPLLLGRVSTEDGEQMQGSEVEQNKYSVHFFTQGLF